MVQATIRQYYALTVLTRLGMGAMAPIYASFLLSKGLNLFEINLVNVVFFVTLFLCEIPTGAFADVFGRRVSYICSCLLYGTGMLVYSQSDIFWEFAAAEILCAIGLTLASGAFEAWLVDNMRHHGFEGDLNPVFSRGDQLKHGAALMGAVAGGALGDISLALPWGVGSILLFVAAAIAYLTMREDYFERKAVTMRSGWEALRMTVHASVEYGYRNQNVRFIMLMVLGLSFSVMAANMQWQPHFKTWLTTPSSLGLLFAGMGFSLMLGARIAPNLLKRVTNERKALITCHALVGIGIVGTVAFGWFGASLAFFLLHEIGRGMFMPIKTAYLHDNIPSRERATIGSFESIAQHVGGTAGLLVSGAVAQWGSISHAWTLSGLTLLALAALLWRNGRAR